MGTIALVFSWTLLGFVFGLFIGIGICRSDVKDAQQWRAFIGARTDEDLKKVRNEISARVNQKLAELASGASGDWGPG